MSPFIWIFQCGFGIPWNPKLKDKLIYKQHLDLNTFVAKLRIASTKPTTFCGLTVLSFLSRSFLFNLTAPSYGSPLLFPFLLPLHTAPTYIPLLQSNPLLFILPYLTFIPPFKGLGVHWVRSWKLESECLDGRGGLRSWCSFCWKVCKKILFLAEVIAVTALDSSVVTRRRNHVFFNLLKIYLFELGPCGL